jgi:hypothetical protein
VIGERDPLWQELAALVAEVDPVPPEVLQTAREAFTRRTVDVAVPAPADQPAVRHHGWRAFLIRCRPSSG